MSTEIKDWPEIIKQWRAAHGLKQEIAANILGVSQSTLSRWESGQSEPTAGARNRIFQMMRNLISPIQTSLWMEILSLTPAAGSVTDGQGRFVAVTAQGLSICGLRREDVIGRPRLEVIAGETAELGLRLRADGIFTGAIAYGEVCHQFVCLATGKEHWYHGTFWPYFNETETNFVVSLGCHPSRDEAMRVRDRLGDLYQIYRF